ncbi:peptide deformylase [Mycolicibacterium sp. 018/SC-01/001]|uniref:peptide deformylase n=1 Tax=Mycolicibacterium sp. 018/SC-01/001 TaxID=2592069 RepID=UPI00163DD178|nr:peptide deformylase [Mycolicibacterium sp. 018/SC-01/001]
MKKQILQWSQTAGSEHPLRQHAIPVDHSNLDETVQVASDLIDTMEAQPLAVGLAANQIGSPLNVAVIKLVNSESPQILVMVNPQVLSQSGKKDRKRESCMSVWGLTGDVERRYKVNIAYADLDLMQHERTFSGFEARIAQHEVDHLNGVLYVDHLGSGELRPTDIFESYEP